MIRRILLFVGLATLAVTPLPASAEVEEIDISSMATFKQDVSGVEFAPNMGNFERKKILRYHTPNDVSASYEHVSEPTWATIYVTRIGTPDVSLWFHRVSSMIQAREGFEPNQADLPKAQVFVAPGFDRPSGLRISYPVKGSNITSTGLAMIVYRDLIVKVRVSSETLGPSDLETTIDEFVAKLDMPDPWGWEKMPYLVAHCTGELAFHTDAKLTEPSEGLGVNLAIMSLMSKDLGNAGVDLPESQFCSDSNSEPRRIIYRENNSTSGYLIPTDDTGRATVVGANNLLGDNSSLSEGFPVSVQRPDQTFIIRPFDKLPTPIAALESVRDENVIARTDRDKNITLNTPPEGEN